jgi:hypothetical protein
VALERLLLQLPHQQILSLLQRLDMSMTDSLIPVLLRIFFRMYGQSLPALMLTHAVVFDAISPASLPAWKLLLQRDKQHPELRALMNLTNSLVKKDITIEQWSEAAEKASDSNAEAEDITAEKDVHQDGVTSYYLPNAGIVLIHPFFPAFCKTMQWVNEAQEWISEQAQQRAVLMLHYIASEKADIPEYELPLCKLLCGWPMHKPVRGLLDISEEEKAEAENLLEHMISNWPILKSTSTQGLRQSFLQRSGKLSQEEQGWRLRMEQQSFDMLLDHLPWTIGVVKTLWMKDLMYVDWV